VPFYLRYKSNAYLINPPTKKKQLLYIFVGCIGLLAAQNSFFTFKTFLGLFKSFALEFFNHTAPRWAPIKFLTSELIKKIYFYF